jgi:hypothetical protein
MGIGRALTARARASDLAGVDLVGLAGQRSQALDLLGVGDLDLPAAALERVVHEPGAVHRLDRRPDRRLAVALLDPACEAQQAVAVGRHRPELDLIALLVEQAEVKPPAAEIQSSVQHENGPPSDSLP